MNPILYPENEELFNNNGIGILSDAISCKTTWSGNGVFDLIMEYPTDGLYFSEIYERRIIYQIPNPYRKPQPYIIKDIVKRMDGVAEIYAEHVLYELSGVPVLPFKASSAAAAMAGLKANEAEKSKFTFTTDKTTVANFAVTVPTPAWNLLGGQEGSILDVYGGEYDFDHWNLKLYNQIGKDNGVVIRYGKNLKDLEQERNIANVYTGVLGYWADMDGNIVYSEPKVIAVEGNFSHKKILTLDLSMEWQDAPTPAQVESRVRSYIKANKVGKPTVSLTVSHELLEQTDEYAGFETLERLETFDTVTVQFEKLGINVKAKVAETVTDALSERYESVKIGSVKASITNTIIKQEQEIQKKPDINTVQQTVNSAAQSIIGAKGGSKLDIFDGEKTVGTMYLDTDDVKTAKNIMLLNNEGIAFTNNGVNGPWTQAITIDGGLANQWIETWKLTANIIAAGILQSRDGKTFFLDLDNGILKMKATELSIGGKTVDQIAQEKADAAQQAASKELQDYANAVTGSLENLQGQIDGQIQTWFYDYVPTASNAPAAEWTTTEEKNKHLGDLFYIVNNATQGGQAYRWALVNGVYKWVLIEDAEVTKALADAAKAQDTADSKRRVFVTQPVPPYDIGDLWTQGTSGDLMRCKTARQGGSYVSSDWEKATKYTDNTALTEFVNGTYKSTVEQLKQQADQKAETWYQSTDPSLNWSASEKPEHSGDIWYNTSTQQSYIYNGTAWQEMKTNPPEAVFDKIDGKAQVFVSQPVPPYSIGDLWTDSSTGDLRRCKTSRASGSFSASDWILATDYVTSSDAADIASGAVAAQTQLDIFNKLTNNGQLQGLFMQDGKLYINATYLSTGRIQKGNSYWDLTNGGLQMEGNFRTSSGNYTFDFWAAVLKLMEGDNLRVRAYTMSSSGGGIVQVFKGTEKENGTKDSTTRYSYLTGESLGVGQNQNGEYVGTVRCGAINAASISADKVSGDSVNVGGGSNYANITSSGINMRSDTYGVKVGMYGTDLNTVHYENILINGSYRKILVVN